MTDVPSYPGTPRWVKVSGVIAIVVVLLLGIMMLTGGGDHGPSRHLPSGDARGQTSPASVTPDEPSSAGVGEHTPPITHDGQEPRP